MHPNTSDNRENRPGKSPTLPRNGFAPETKAGLVAGAAFVLVFGLALAFLRWDAPFPAVLFVLGGVPLVLGIAGLWYRPSKAPAIQLRLGNVRLRIGAGFGSAILGLCVMGYATFLAQRTTWTFLLSEEAIQERVSQEVTSFLAERCPWLLPNASDESESQVPEGQRLLREAAEHYAEADYEKCLAILERIKTTDEGVIDEMLFYSLMAEYHLLETSARRFKAIPTQEFSELEGKFLRFLRERQESRRFCILHYWLGQLYLQVSGDRDKAMGVFDNIIANYAYSKWLQGSLYYSAVLHHERGAPGDSESAIRNLKILAREDGDLKIVEANREVDGATAAKQLLSKWGVPHDKQSLGIPHTEADGNVGRQDAGGDAASETRK